MTKTKPNSTLPFSKVPNVNAVLPLSNDAGAGVGRQQLIGMSLLFYSLTTLFFAHVSVLWLLGCTEEYESGYIKCLGYIKYFVGYTEQVFKEKKCALKNFTCGLWGYTK